ncbi:hypothetical protein T261_08413 [Streptomyces lydicus]|nr:hypothetical protein T261_08413 [Streptomyces lydicus]
MAQLPTFTQDMHFSRSLRDTHDWFTLPRRDNVVTSPAEGVG